MEKAGEATLLRKTKPNKQGEGERLNDG